MPKAKGVFQKRDCTATKCYNYKNFKCPTAFPEPKLCKCFGEGAVPKLFKPDKPQVHPQAVSLLPRNSRKSYFSQVTARYLLARARRNFVALNRSYLQEISFASRVLKFFKPFREALQGKKTVRFKRCILHQVLVSHEVYCPAYMPSISYCMICPKKSSKISYLN